MSESLKISYKHEFKNRGWHFIELNWRESILTNVKYQFFVYYIK